MLACCMYSAGRWPASRVAAVMCSQPFRFISSLVQQTAVTAAQPDNLGWKARPDPAGLTPLRVLGALVHAGTGDDTHRIAAAQLLPRYSESDVQHGSDMHWTQDGRQESRGSVAGSTAIVKSVELSVRPAAADSVLHEVNRLSVALESAH